ncbi:MAG: hypothetical protein IPM95_15970 [Sphingobacteriales bacterium]|nr:hypothetical protein [Sphingobacteriales bacterium]
MNSIFYYFHYDSTDAKLTRIDFDTLGVLTIEHDINKVDILFNVPSVFYSKYTAFINPQNQITSVYTFDSFSLAYREKYRFNYTGATIDSMKFLLSYNPLFKISINEYDLLFNGQNNTEMKYNNTGSDYYGSIYTYYDTLIFSYTPLLNSHQLPFQNLFTLSAFGRLEMEQSILRFDPLYLFGLLGYKTCNANYNLLRTAGERRYTYETNSENKVTGMTITDTTVNAILYKYAIDYY